MRFMPLSTNPDKIRSSGALMPNLLLLTALPQGFVRYERDGNIGSLSKLC
jgi:hypothetical protein